jgi:hypothetical protein
MQVGDWVALFVGLAGVVVALAGATSSTRIKRLSIASGALLVTFAVVVAVVTALGSSRPQPPTSDNTNTESATPSPIPPCGGTATRGSLTEPLDHATVPQKTLARGTICNVSGGHEIVLMLLYGDCFFPERVQVANDNTWWGEISVGGGEAKGLDFILYLVDIGKDGVAELEAYGIAEGKRGYAVGICSKEEVMNKYQGTFLDAVPITREA